MNTDELLKQIKTGLVKNTDLSSLSLKDIDFHSCSLENVTFSTSKTKTHHSNLNFKGCKLDRVYFDHAILTDCNFDSIKEDDEWKNRTEIRRTSFKNAEVKAGRFRGAQFFWSDFRYSELINGTFEEAEIEFCDFYRAFFLGVVIFRKSIFDNCSLYYTHFDESAGIKLENFKSGKIIQEDKHAYRMFLEEWATRGTGERVNNLDEKSAWRIEKSIQNRYADAEEIYKTFNGFWQAKGLLGDSNRAYVKGKRMERMKLWKELLKTKFSWRSLVMFLQIFWNLFKDICFGYGESMRRMIITYIVVVLLFAYFFYAYPKVRIFDYVFALKVSFKNMVAISSNQLQNVSPFIDMLNVLQTTIGILLTGIFGFILGNKIRNQ